MSETLFYIILGVGLVVGVLLFINWLMSWEEFDKN